MNRLLTVLHPLALAAGLAGIAGAALAAARHHPVALAMTLLIAAFYALGVVELRAFRRASRAGLHRFNALEILVVLVGICAWSTGTMSDTRSASRPTS